MVIFRESMKIREYIPGFIIVLIIATLSYFISSLNESFDILVISIIAGVFLGNIIGDKEYFTKGTEASLRLFLPLGIAFYGTQLTFRQLQMKNVMLIFLVFAGLFSLTLFTARVFNVRKKMAVLLASGVSVCGASAIAIISPLIEARREDTSISVLSVMMLGLTGMIFYPALADILSLRSEEFNFLAGTTLPMLGQVKVAAGSYCPECLSEAVNIKLVRISFLMFLISVAIFLSGGKERKAKVPWFIVVFIILAVLANFTEIFVPADIYLKCAGSIFLSAALAAIGFSVDFDAIMEEGMKPLGILFLSWSVVVLITYIGLSLIYYV